MGFRALRVGLDRPLVRARRLVELGDVVVAAPDREYSGAGAAVGELIVLADTLAETARNAAKIEAWDRVGLLKDLATLTSDEKVNMIGVRTEHDDDRTTHVYLTLETTGVEQLSRLMAKMESARGIISVSRHVDERCRGRAGNHLRDQSRGNGRHHRPGRGGQRGRSH